LGYHHDGYSTDHHHQTMYQHQRPIKRIIKMMADNR
jgi:hypothetical protein